MKIGTFAEAIQSLKERCRKNIIESRAMMIALWFQLALIVGILCSYLVVRASAAYAITLIEVHPHQPAPSIISEFPNLWLIGFWLFTVGLPILTLILGIRGILPGTRKKP